MFFVVRPKRTRAPLKPKQPPRKQRQSLKKLKLEDSEVSTTETSQSFQMEKLGCDDEGQAAQASGGALTSSPLEDKEIVNIRVTTQTVDFRGSVGAAAQLGFKAGGR